MESISMIPYIRLATPEDIPSLELASTLPGEPLDSAMGYEMLERIDVLLYDGVTLPVRRMRKEI